MSAFKEDLDEPSVLLGFLSSLRMRGHVEYRGVTCFDQIHDRGLKVQLSDLKLDIEVRGKRVFYQLTGMSKLDSVIVVLVRWLNRYSTILSTNMGPVHYFTLLNTCCRKKYTTLHF
jgi:hypothetical protein